MLRITKQADYGIVLLGHIAGLGDGERKSTKDLSQETGIPQPMVGKILKMVAHSGLVSSHRGVHGGYFLARPATEIPLTAIIESLDGPIQMTACCDIVDAGTCQIESSCRTRVNWQRINVRIHEVLSSMTLAEMIEPAVRPTAEEVRP